MKTKIKSYSDETTAFHDKEMSKVCSYRTCLVVITIDFAFKEDDNYYHQVFLKELKHIGKEKKVIRHIAESIKHKIILTE